MEHVEIIGRVGTWYEVDRNQNYILFESEKYGDEAGMILTDYELNEITETWDNLETTVEELLAENSLDFSEDIEMGFDPYSGCYTDDC